jgi:hypothetical protein
MPITTPAETLSLYNNDRDHFAHVLEHLLVPAIARAGYTAISPRLTGGDIIQATIIRHLEEAELVLCDISLHNPNVFFELGVRTALDLPVALVKDDRTSKLPFDTSIINTYTYDSALSPWLLESQIADISEHIKLTVTQGRERNALWQYFGLTKRAAIPARTDDPNAAKMDLMLEEIKRIRMDVSTGPSTAESSASDLELARTAKIAQFLSTAVASESNPNGKDAQEYPKSYRELIADLAKIADDANVAIRVIRLASDSITIDAGPFYVSSATEKLLERRTTQDAKELILLGDYIGASPG